MLATLHVLVGPFIRCRFGITQTTETIMKIRTVCGNNQCSLFHKDTSAGPFCSKCGNPVTKLQTGKQVAKNTPSVSCHQWEGLIEESDIIGKPLFEIRHYLESNPFPEWNVKEQWFVGLHDKRRKPLRPYLYTVSTITELEIIGLPNAPDEIAWFENAYKQEIDLFRLIYEDVKVDWGILSYQY